MSPFSHFSSLTWETAPPYYILTRKDRPKAVAQALFSRGPLEWKKKVEVEIKQNEKMKELKLVITTLEICGKSKKGEV